jgi:hypothetical protein
MLPSYLAPVGTFPSRPYSLLTRNQAIHIPSPDNTRRLTKELASETRNVGLHICVEFPRDPNDDISSSTRSSAGAQPLGHSSWGSHMNTIAVVGDVEIWEELES